MIRPHKPNILNIIFSSTDDQKFDLFYFLTFISVISGIAFQYMKSCYGYDFNFMEYGVGMGGILTGAAIALNIKRSGVQPPHEP